MRHIILFHTHLYKSYKINCLLYDLNFFKCQKFKETGDSRYIYRNELDKVRFQHDMAYGDFKDLDKRTASDNVLGDKAYNEIINNEDFDSNLLKIDKRSYNNIDITLDITIKNISDYNCINSVKPLYFIIGKEDGYIEE